MYIRNSREMRRSHEKTAVRATYFSIVGNTALAIIKGLAGFFGNSYALIADAIESTTDIFSFFLVLFGIKYASRPADKITLMDMGEQNH